MSSIPKKVEARLKKTVPEYQKVIRAALDRDINEADTVTIVTDMLAGVFGFDKYADITGEQAIRGTYCDLAVKIDGKIKYLIEVKAIGLNLKENHLRQAIGYGASEGVPWVVLTNGAHWEIYRIKFEQPVSHELVCKLSFQELSARSSDALELLFILCKEGIARSAIEEFHERSQTVNRFIVGAIIQSSAVVPVIRREIRKLAAGVRVTDEEITQLLSDVLKRDLLDGEQALAARKQIARVAKKSSRKRGTITSETGKPARAD